MVLFKNLIKNVSRNIKFIRNKSYVRVVEVGPRDGLQNEPVNVPTNVKIEFIDMLSDTGLKNIEVTSFVSPKWVPQMADNVEVFTAINKKEDISYPVLVPNLTGLSSAAGFPHVKISGGIISATSIGAGSRFHINSILCAGPVIKMASTVIPCTGIKVVVQISSVELQAILNFEKLDAGVQEIAVFLSASEGFSKKNINCSIDEGLNRVKNVISKALENNIKVRGYISCVVGCPYDGYIKPSSVSKVAEALLSEGCYEISLGDTIGVGTKITIENMLYDLLNFTTSDKLAIHCHDTYGQALVNIYTALERGITVVDSSVGGLGGCPYAKGATGNVSTEDLVYMLHGLGTETGVDLNKLIFVGQYISKFLDRSPVSKVNNALYSKLF